jgi:hypothetical protein
MAETSVVEATISPGSMLTAERRANCRYPIQVELEYAIVRGRRALRTGDGHLVNISRGGLLFQCDQAIPVGNRIELDVEWPARGAKMVLHVAGQTVRSQGVCTAVKILRNSFRTLHGDAERGKRPYTPA